LSSGLATGATPASQTLVRGLDVLEQVADGPVPLALLAQRLGLSRSTVHRLATTLLERRYLNLTPRRGYTLGPKLLELGTQAREQINLVRLAEPALDALAEATGDVALLGVRDGTRMLLADRAGGRRPIAPSIRPGERQDLTETALGLALLLDEDAAALTGHWHRLHDSAASGFLTRMKDAAAAGLVIDLGTTDPHICTLAAPVRDAQGVIRAAVSIAAATAYFSMDTLAEARAAVLTAAAGIAAELGWHTGRAVSESDSAEIAARNLLIQPLSPSTSASLPAERAILARARDQESTDVERFAMKGRPA